MTVIQGLNLVREYVATGTPLMEALTHTVKQQKMDTGAGDPAVIEAIRPHLTGGYRWLQFWVIGRTKEEVLKVLDKAIANEALKEVVV